jgi:hypothetical protein
MPLDQSAIVATTDTTLTAGCRTLDDARMRRGSAGWHQDCILSAGQPMSPSAHELVLDLEPAVTAENGRLYHASVVASAAADGHWNAWLEFVSPDSQDVLRTDIETHQATETDLHRWAMTLSDVYLRGALERAVVSRSETVVHRRAIAQGAAAGTRGMADALDPFELFALGEHVLRRELQLFKRAPLLALIINHDLNPTALDLSKFTKAQLVTFIVTAVETRQTRTGGNRRGRPRAS